MAPPVIDAEKRKICWIARDTYYNCRLQYSSDEERENKCGDLLKNFETSCPKIWVKHFNKSQNLIEYKKDFQASKRNES